MIASRRAFLAALGGVASAVALRAAKVEGGKVTVIRFDVKGKKVGPVTIDKVVLSDDEWRKKLSSEEFEVTRHADTERAFTGRYWNNHDKGLYSCICCGNSLFTSDTKFDSGTGWPSFWAPVAKENVEEHRDTSFGVVRTEVKCKECDAHLGHVFDDGPRPTGLRYCMNSVSLKFEKA